MPDLSANRTTGGNFLAQLKKWQDEESPMLQCQALVNVSAKAERLRTHFSQCIMCDIHILNDIHILDETTIRYLLIKNYVKS